MRKPKAGGEPCPNPDCASYRLLNRGNVSAISTYLTQSGTRRIFRCKDCESTFSETRDTVFFDLRTSAEQVRMALKMLLVKVGLSDIGFVLGVTCVFHGILPPNPQESCHSVHVKVAMQSIRKLPPNPSESCHPIHAKVAIDSGAKLPLPSERSDAKFPRSNLLSPGLSMTLHVAPPDVALLSS